MAKLPSYTRRNFTPSANLLASDPSTGTQLIPGQSLLDFIGIPGVIERLEGTVQAIRTTDLALTEDLPVGRVIYTTGESTENDGSGGHYVVVLEGTGGLPMDNGNELLLLPLGLLGGSDATDLDVTPALATASTGTQTVAEALDGREIIATDLAALKAIDATNLPDGAGARITTTGRAGAFAWRLGDFSAEVAGDPLEGIYVKADGVGASAGAWVRSLSVGLVTPEMFGAIGDGVADDTASLQASIDSGTAYIYIEKKYKVSKSDSFSDLFPNNDQPCLFVYERDNVSLLGPGKLICDEHAQGILEFQKCESFSVSGITLVGAGSFPQLDGSTGRGEKGTSSAGYGTSGFWGYYKNNSNDTADNTTGGFGGNFPQFSGGTASTWGEWNGGFIGNVSYGILVHNGCRNGTIKEVKVSGFNYVGIAVGHNGDYFPTDLGYEDSKFISILGCDTRFNYSAGVHVMACENVSVTGNNLSNAGHPEANPATDAAADPGYGITLRGSSFSFAKKVIVSNNFARDNVRKGIDVHAGDDILICDNILDNNGVSGIFAAWSSDVQQASRVVITGNQLSGNSLANAGSLGSIYLGGRPDATTLGKYVVANNNIINSGGSSIWARYLSNLSITGNRIEGSTPQSSGAHILVFAEGSQIENNIAVTGNFIYDADNGMGRGIQLSRIEDGIISSNKIVMKGVDVNIGLYTINCNDVDVFANSVKLGATGNPIAINQSNGVNQGNVWKGGSEVPLLYTSPGAQRHQRLADSMSFTLVFDGSATPTILNSTAPDVTVSATEIPQGFRVNLHNIGSIVRMQSSYIVTSSEGIKHTASGNANPYIYQRAISATALEYGLKPTGPTGSHAPASEFESGALSITVFLQ